MEILGCIVSIIVVGAVLANLRQQNNAPGLALQQKFMQLGTLQGKRKHEIIARVGPPCSFWSVSDGKSLLQWQATGYDISLLFNGETCEGVTHEYVSQG